MEKKITNFSVDSGQMKEVDAALKNLLNLCRLYQLPMFATVAVSNSNDGTKYASTIYEARAHDVELKEDLVRKHMLVAKGFEPVPKRDVISVNFAEVLNIE